MLHKENPGFWMTDISNARKGPGLHKSDMICSTIGWLKEANQTLEYGKNYDDRGTVCKTGVPFCIL